MEKRRYEDTARWRAAVKQLATAPLSDDFIFYNVLRHNHVAAHLVALIDSSYKKEELTISQEQKPFDPGGDARGIRLDMFLQNLDGDMIDFEMQNKDNHDTANRTGYYHAVMATEMLKKGQSYRQRHSTCVIMITMYDYFGDGKAIHKITSRSQDGHKYPDKQTTYLIYPYGDLTGLPRDLQDFLKLLTERTTSDGEFITMVKELMISIKTSGKMRYDFMRLQDKLMDAYEEAYEEAYDEATDATISYITRYNELVAQGLNSQEIMEQLVAQFGEEHRSALEKIVLALS
ncbi:Rpn family recombination-promoting nuclease/putative transposase [Ligilactobacillus equi]|nr:Rpn family recombination-promoting nuclease/putative transposase [Ligilactobacillus equi]